MNRRNEPLAAMEVQKVPVNTGNTTMDLNLQELWFGWASVMAD